MKRVDPSRVLGVGRLGLTHALRIPLATRTSRPQLESSLRRVMSDPTTSDIHPAAIRPPDMQYLQIGTLSLETSEAKAKALTVLEELELDRMLLQCMQSRSPGIGKNHPQPHMLTSWKPLRVSLSGLVHLDILHSCTRLYVPIVDHTGLLSDFTQAIRTQLLSAGLMVVDRRQKVPLEPGPPPLQTRIIHNRRLQTRIVNENPSLLSRLPDGQVVYRLATFDLREFYNKFKDVMWAANFPLERLCLSELNSCDIVKDGILIGRGCREMASVPLPGVQRLGTEPELQGVEYVQPRITVL